MFIRQEFAENDCKIRSSCCVLCAWSLNAIHLQVRLARETTRESEPRRLEDTTQLFKVFLKVKKAENMK